MSQFSNGTNHSLPPWHIGWHADPAVGGRLQPALLLLAGCHFSFPAGASPPVYGPVIHAGFDLGSEVKVLPGGGVTSDKPFFFSVDVPEGNWSVAITLSGGSATIRAEGRRLLAENMGPGTRTFTVNVRYPEIREGEGVRLKSRKLGALDRDHARLTRIFTGPSRVCQTAGRGGSPVDVTFCTTSNSNAPKFCPTWSAPR